MKTPTRTETFALNGCAATLMLGDCLDLLPIEADAVITDPPYGVDWNTDYRRFSTGFDVERTNHRKVANDDRPFDPTPFLSYQAVVMFGANCFAEKLPMGSWLIWDKRFSNGKAFLADGEAAWMKGGHGIYICSVTSQGFVRDEPIEHPTQKPVRVMAWCIEKAKVKQGGVILDPYMGGGTTGVACLRTGRNFIGIEKDERHFQTACERIKRECEQQLLFA